MIGILIVHTTPPNYETIIGMFPAAARPGTIFAYGDRVFVPNGERLPQCLVAHEYVHCQRQVAMEGGPDAWWARYLNDTEFRLHEEVLAHRVEYNVYCKESHSVGGRKEYLFRMAQRLASPLYGRTCSIAEAKRYIQGEKLPGEVTCPSTQP